MGSNASKSTSAYSVRNYSTILRNGNACKLGDLDVSERHLLLELKKIILMDKILINGSLTVTRYQNQCCSVSVVPCKCPHGYIYTLSRDLETVFSTVFLFEESPTVPIRCNKSGLQFLYLYVCAYFLKFSIRITCPIGYKSMCLWFIKENVISLQGSDSIS